MKLKLTKLTFNLLSYLSDKTRGNAFVVKYKLLIGTFLLSATQATAQDATTIDDNKPTISNMRVTCYKPAPASYTRKGKIVLDTNVPIKDVTITVEGTHLKTQSDENGDFEIEVRSFDTLVFSREGYAEKEISIKDLVNNEPLVIIMIPELPIHPLDYITCYDISAESLTK